VIRCELVRSHSGHTHRRVESLNAELIFEADWQAMERTNNLTSLCEPLIKIFRPRQRAVDKDLCETVRLPTADGE